MRRRFSRGDTLIEVMFASAVFSLVAVGALSVMNQGAAAAQRGLEITLVRQEMDAQAEALRFLNTSYTSAFNSGGTYTGKAKEWQNIKNFITAHPGSASSLETCTPPQSRSFVLNTKKVEFVYPSGVGIPSDSKTFSQLVYDSSDNIVSIEGVWIEAVEFPTELTNNQSNAGYVDFHIRACWDSPGQAIPVTLGTIVRLYEPR